MKTRTKTITGLILIGIVDAIIPFPILAVILIHVVFQKPAWFAGIVRDVYRTL
ncbi:MAG: hypothetical protein JSV71_04190 [Nitrospiraceae bacterium]|nr:MAG: hypothetical protein JSV71_04190 [Nitrospiraceae bacterium]